MKQIVRIPLTRVPWVLRARNYTKGPLSYKRLYAAAVDQRIPATQDDNGRWFVTEPDLRLIAETLCTVVAA
jgi:hypothetical protein